MNEIEKAEFLIANLLRHKFENPGSEEHKKAAEEYLKYKMEGLPKRKKVKHDNRSTDSETSAT